MKPVCIFGFPLWNIDQVALFVVLFTEHGPSCTFPNLFYGTCITLRNMDDSARLPQYFTEHESPRTLPTLLYGTCITLHACRPTQQNMGHSSRFLPCFTEHVSRCTFPNLLYGPLARVPFYFGVHELPPTYGTGIDMQLFRSPF